MPMSLNGKYSITILSGYQSLIYPRMLFQFHQDQNAKEPRSVCAVYLLSGLWAPASPTASAPDLPGDGKDAYMRSSPFMSSSMPHKEEEEEPQAVRSVVMCREEDLKGRSVMTASAPPVEC